MSSKLKIGQSYAAEYPRSNVEGVRLRYKLRRFRVTAIRDLDDEPLKAGTYERDPLVRRRGNLAVVWDHDLQEERWFYLGALRAVRLLDESEVQVRYRVVRTHDQSIAVESTDDDGVRVICGLANSERPYVVAVPFALPDYRLTGLQRHLAS